MRILRLLVPVALVLVSASQARADEEVIPPGRVRAIFEPSAPHVVLERRPERRKGGDVDSEGGTVVAMAGDDVLLDPKATYQIGGTWVEPTSFSLPAGDPGPFRITATPGSSRTAGWGTGLVLAGGGLLVLGGGTAATLGFSGATKNAEADSGASIAFTSSLVVAAVGLVLVLVSLPFRSESTKVEVTKLR